MRETTPCVTVRMDDSASLYSILSITIVLSTFISVYKIISQMKFINDITKRKQAAHHANVVGYNKINVISLH